MALRKVSAAAAAIGAAAFVLCAARPARACVCAQLGPSCTSVQNTGTIFVGKVLSIDASSHTEPSPDMTRPIVIPELRVRMSVSEPFAGQAGSTVEVVTGIGGGDCGYPFAVDATYLVYADGRDGAATPLNVGICSGTRLVSLAADDLAYWRGLAGTGPRLSRLVGVAQPDRAAALTKAHIRVTGQKTYDTVVDLFGRFELFVAPGRYVLTMVRADGTEVSASALPLVVDGSASCTTVPLTVGRLRPSATSATSSPRAAARGGGARPRDAPRARRRTAAR